MKCLWMVCLLVLIVVPACFADSLENEKDYTIGEVKALDIRNAICSQTTSTVVRLSGKVVTAAWPDFFYIQEKDRSAGIRVIKPANGLKPGDVVSVEGTASQTNTGEQCFTASSIIVSHRDDPIRPLGLSNRQATSDCWRWVRLPNGDYEYKWATGGLGLMAQGLFVRIWGRINQIDPAGTYLYVWDGTDVWDGTFTNGERNRGIRCFMNSVPEDIHLEQFVTLDGVLSVYWEGEQRGGSLLYCIGAPHILIE